MEILFELFPGLGVNAVWRVSADGQLLVAEPTAGHVEACHSLPIYERG